MPCPNSARKRSKTMAFRVSPEEYEQITNLAKLSGMDRSRAECWCKGPLPLPQKAGSGYRLEF